MKSYTELMRQEKFDTSGPVLKSEEYPRTRFLVVGTPRSGSNLLCDLLYQSGFGVPMEYFSTPAAHHLIDRWGVNASEYVAEVVNRRTTDGIFGAKLFYPHEFEFARHVWPTHLIRLQREDKQAQARSFALANKTGYFADVGDPDERPETLQEPSAQEITQAEQIILQLEQFWNSVNVDAMVSYEYIVRDKEDTLRNIAQLLGYPLPEAWEAPTPRVKKLHRGGPVDLGDLA